MERVTQQQVAMMPIEFKLNGQTVVGRPDRRRAWKLRPIQRAP